MMHQLTWTVDHLQTDQHEYQERKVCATATEQHDVLGES